MIKLKPSDNTLYKSIFKLKEIALLAGYKNVKCFYVSPFKPKFIKVINTTMKSMRVKEEGYKTEIKELKRQLRYKDTYIKKLEKE